MVIVFNKTKYLLFFGNGGFCSFINEKIIIAYYF